MLKKQSHNSDADAEVKALRVYVMEAIRLIRHLTAKTEALRVFAERAGAFSQDEYDRAYTTALHAFDEATGHSLEEAVQEATATMQQRMLEKHDGDPQ